MKYIEGDLISRSELKNEFDIIARNSATGELQFIPIRHIKQIIDAAPAANKERQSGKWIEGFGVYLCSECGQIIGKYKKNYCATCGADMRGKEND